MIPGLPKAVVVEEEAVVVVVVVHRTAKGSALDVGYANPTRRSQSERQCKVVQIRVLVGPGSEHILFKPISRP